MGARFARVQNFPLRPELTIRPRLNVIPVTLKLRTAIAHLRMLQRNIIACFAVVGPPFLSGAFRLHRLHFIPISQLTSQKLALRGAARFLPRA
jgi:hypothetical protein